MSLFFWANLTGKNSRIILWAGVVFAYQRIGQVSVAGLWSRSTCDRIQIRRTFFLKNFSKLINSKWLVCEVEAAAGTWSRVMKNHLNDIIFHVRWWKRFLLGSARNRLKRLIRGLGSRYNLSSSLLKIWKSPADITSVTRFCATTLLIKF